jgi:hypothetical protein
MVLIETLEDISDIVYSMVTADEFPALQELLGDAHDLAVLLETTATPDTDPLAELDTPPWEL